MNVRGKMVYILHILLDELAFLPTRKKKMITLSPSYIAQPEKHESTSYRHKPSLPPRGNEQINRHHALLGSLPINIRLNLEKFSTLPVTMVISDNLEPQNELISHENQTLKNIYFSMVVKLCLFTLSGTLRLRLYENRVQRTIRGMK